MFVCNSAKYSDLGQPFGYLKASTALNCVNLFVMPYNYPVLLPLLGETDDLYVRISKPRAVIFVYKEKQTEAKLFLQIDTLSCSLLL